jgi:hypothetical protein
MLIEMQTRTWETLLVPSGMFFFRDGEDIVAPAGNQSDGEDKREPNAEKDAQEGRLP